MRLGEAESWIARKPAEDGVTTAAQRVFIAASRKAATARHVITHISQIFVLFVVLTIAIYILKPDPLVKKTLGLLIIALSIFSSVKIIYFSEEKK